MLLERCPDLEELTMGGASPARRLFDIRHVMSGRWPRLRRLVFGDIVLQLDDESASSLDEKAFNDFFLYHSKLDVIALQHAGGNPNMPSSFLLPQYALPSIETFSGPLRYVRTLPQPTRLKHLALTCLHHIPSSFPPTLAVLYDLPSLISLTIWIDLSFGGRVPHDEGQMFRTLLAACPRLIHLDIMCLTRPTFHIVSHFTHKNNLAEAFAKMPLKKFIIIIIIIIYRESFPTR